MNIYNYKREIARYSHTDPEKVEAIKKELSKVCFTCCEELKWDYKSILEHAKSYGKRSIVSFDYIFNYAKKYAEMESINLDERLLILSKSRKLYNLSKQWHFKGSKVALLCSLLELDIDTQKEDIISLIENSNYAKQISVLIHYIHDFIVLYCVEDYDLVKSKLLDRIAIYKEYAKEQARIKREERAKNRALLKKEELINLLPEAREVVLDYVDSSSITIFDYCQEVGIEVLDFRDHLNVVKELDEETYNLYLDVGSKKRGILFSILLKKIEQIAISCNFGVYENGKFREFDLIDYFSMTNLHFKDILNIVYKYSSSFSKTDIKAIRKFIDKNKKYEKENYKEIEREISAKRGYLDKDGNIIGWYTEDEKLEESAIILDYLSEHKIPANSRTYNLVRRRYWANKELFIQQNNNLKFVEAPEAFDESANLSKVSQF